MRRAYSRLQYANVLRLTKEGGSFRIGPTIAKRAGLSELIPIADFDSAAPRLLDLGKTLVIGEQGTDSRARTRVLTPAARAAAAAAAATDFSQHSYIAALCITAAKRVGIAWADLTDGSLWFQSSNHTDIHDDLARISPRQIVVEAPPDLRHPALDLFPIVHAKFPRNLTFAFEFDSPQAIKHVVDTAPPVAIAAIAGLLGYLSDTQTSQRLDPPREFLVGNTLGMDKRARTTLELTASASGTSRGSLFNVIKRTRTQSGARLLHQLLTSPLRDIEAINTRLDTVAKLLANPVVLMQAQDALSGYPDGKLCIQRLNTGPSARHLHTWSQAIEGLKHMANLLRPWPEFSTWLARLDECIHQTGKLSTKIHKYMDMDLSETDPGTYQPIFHPEISKPLQDLYKTNHDFEATCSKVLEDYATRYDSPPKVQWLPSLGYHILVKGPPHPSDSILRGGKKTSRLHDPVLARAGKVREEFDQRLEQLERKILERLYKQVMDLSAASRAGLDAMDEIDLLQSFATLASESNLVRPIITPDPILDIVDGRHIAVEAFTMVEQGTNFVPNDCRLVDPKVCMVTGPNMGGKSTFMRQTATIAILAHMGCYVPAKSATIGLIDKIFCRIGSGDDGYRGQSTFMIEMLETSHILRNATSSSLAMLDEVGRGTSKKDGIALAYASIQHIITETKCRALFATHFGPGLEKLLKEDGLSVAMQQSINYRMAGGVCTDSRGLEMARVAIFPPRALDDAINYLEGQ